MKETTLHAHKTLRHRNASWMFTAVATLPFTLLAGCKKDETPPPEITVQAEHPEQGSISEHIVADAILGTSRNRSQDQRAGQEFLRPAWRKGERR